MLFSFDFCYLGWNQLRDLLRQFYFWFADVLTRSWHHWQVLYALSLTKAWLKCPTVREREIFHQPLKTPITRDPMDYHRHPHRLWGPRYKLVTNCYLRLYAWNSYINMICCPNRAHHVLRAVLNISMKPFLSQTCLNCFSMRPWGKQSLSQG